MRQRTSNVSRLLRSLLSVCDRPLDAFELRCEFVNGLNEVRHGHFGHLVHPSLLEDNMGREKVVAGVQACAKAVLEFELDEVV